MNLKAGTIYFIGEKDIISNELTPFIKMGLIREGEARTSQARLLEHQTGNPRELVLRAEINTPAVSELESVMHNIFAPFRVNGEWFNFDEVLLRNALDTCQDLADQIKTSLPALKSAEAFAGETSDGTILNATLEMLKWHEVHNIQEAIERRCESVLMKIKAAIRTEATNGNISAEIAEVSARKTSFKLDKESFKIAYPEIYAHYEKTTTTISGIFKVLPVQTVSTTSDVHEKINNLTIEVEVLLQAESVSDHIELLHKKHLELIGIHSQAMLLKDIAKAQLRSLCGKADGVADVCTWKRTTKSKTVLDEKDLVERHPDLVAPYMKETKEVTTMVVKRRSKPTNSEKPSQTED